MNYGNEEALPTPYKRARQVWDDRLGSSRKQAYSWRLAAFAAFVLTGIMAIGLIYQSSKAQVVPYIVEVDEAGKVRLVGTPRTQTWEPSDATRFYFLEEWVKNVRSLSSDREVVRQQWLEAYQGVTDHAKAQLDAHAQKSQPFKTLGEQTRRVEVEAINDVSDDSYRVEWTEEVYGKGGDVIERQRYVGVFKLTRKQPKTAEELRKNALGLYVDHFSWSKQFKGEE